MRSALLVAACVLSCLALPGPAAADELPRRVGYEVGGWRWTRSPDVLFMEWPEDGAVTIVSVGRWQRLRPSATWETRLQYADLFPRARQTSWNTKSRYENGRSVTVQTGLALHPPVRTGLAPFVGVSIGAGYVRQGAEHITTWSYGGWPLAEVESVKRHRAGIGLSAGVEAGVRMFSRPGWPTFCVTFGSRTVVGQGFGTTTEPVVSVGL